MAEMLMTEKKKDWIFSMLTQGDTIVTTWRFLPLIFKSYCHLINKSHSQ